MRPIRHGTATPAGSRRASFALIELLLVVVVLAIIGGIAIPRFHNAMQRQRVESAALRLISDLDLARRQARTSNSAVSVFFDNLGPRYTLVGVQHLDRAGAPYLVDVGKAPYEVAMTYSAKNGGSVLVFDGYGQPSTELRVELRAGDATVAVVVDASTGIAARTE